MTNEENIVEPVVTSASEPAVDAVKALKALQLRSANFKTADDGSLAVFVFNGAGNKNAEAFGDRVQTFITGMEQAYSKAGIKPVTLAPELGQNLVSNEVTFVFSAVDGNRARSLTEKILDDAGRKPPMPLERLAGALNAGSSQNTSQTPVSSQAQVPIASTLPSNQANPPSANAVPVAERVRQAFAVGPDNGKLRATDFDFHEVDFNHTNPRWYRDRLWKNVKKGDVLTERNPGDIEAIKDVFGNDPETIAGIAQVRWSKNKLGQKDRVTFLLETGEEMQAVYKKNANGEEALSHFSFRHSHVSVESGRKVLDALEASGQSIDNIAINGTPDFRRNMKSAIETECKRRETELKQHMAEWRGVMSGDSFNYGTTQAQQLNTQRLEALTKGDGELAENLSRRLEIAQATGAKADRNMQILDLIYDKLRDDNTPRSVVSQIMRENRDSLNPKHRSSFGDPSFEHIAVQLGVDPAKLSALGVNPQTRQPEAAAQSTPTPEAEANTVTSAKPRITIPKVA